MVLAKLQTHRRTFKETCHAQRCSRQDKVCDSSRNQHWTALAGGGEGDVGEGSTLPLCFHSETERATLTGSL